MTREHTIHTRHNVYWIATFDDYDGAPDAGRRASMLGHGKTELAAIADLLEQERDLDRS